MFNFTTQTVYNSIQSATVAAKGDRVPAGANLIVSTVGKQPSLRIGNTRFDADSILDIQVKAPTPEHLAKVTFDMSKALIPQDSQVNEQTARIALYVGLSMNSQNSFYANDYVYKGKPLYVEFKVKKSDTAATLAKRVKANADKYLLFVMGPEKILEVSTETAAASGDNPATGTVTFKGVNGYQQIKKAVLQVFNPDAKTVDCCTSQGEYEDVITGVPVDYTFKNGDYAIGDHKMGETELEDLAEDEVAIEPGIEAFGDYNWIIHNLRLPTAANTNFWAVNKQEMPVPGQQYTQFIVRLIKERDGIMGEIVGARGVSVTTHVLYVSGTVAAGAAKTVNDAFTTLLGANASTKMKTEADTTLADPFASVR